MHDVTISVNPTEFDGLQQPPPESYLSEPTSRTSGRLKLNSIVSKHGAIHLQRRTLCADGQKPCKRSYGLIVLLEKDAPAETIADVVEALKMMGMGALSIWSGESKEGHPCVFCTTPNTQEGRSNPVGYLARLINDASIASVRVHGVDELILKRPGGPGLRGEARKRGWLPGERLSVCIPEALG